VIFAAVVLDEDEGLAVTSATAGIEVHASSRTREDLAVLLTFDRFGRLLGR